ncbi:MAG: hypothetical protein GF353_05585 [Candidatus Lokiarchaeota archaeon]|nr:hypothetical protein [Candidatus Lokiarchaeota archaeon]
MKCPKCGHWSLFEFRVCRKCNFDIRQSDSKHQIFTENDNLGTRYDTESLASSYFISRTSGNITVYKDESSGAESDSIESPVKNEPYLLYEFESEKNAIAALLELPCIHLAKDSDKLICSEVLGFGYYLCKETGKYETILCGKDMTLELWKKAEASFSNSGGRKINGLEPKEGMIKKKVKPKPGKVVFLRKDSKNVMGVNAIYEVYKGPDANSAKAFLEKKPVTKRFYCIVVETPDGNYCRDIQGFYKE